MSATVRLRASVGCVSLDLSALLQLDEHRPHGAGVGRHAAGEFPLGERVTREKVASRTNWSAVMPSAANCASDRRWRVRYAAQRAIAMSRPVVIVGRG
jgi:hypothetical protein